jgi:hydrogenase maturation protease
MPKTDFGFNHWINPMPHMLIIGYGNLDRGDDGAALHVVNRLRLRFGQPPLAEEDGGLVDLGRDTAVFVPQLVPELAINAASYESIVLVDAHVTEELRPVVYLRLQPQYQPPTLSHQLSPAMFAWLVQAAPGKNRAAFLVSLRGHRFEAQRGLSPATAALVEPAAEKVLELLHA